MLGLWILTHRRVGDLQQMRTLAAILEARVVEKQIRFHNAQLARSMPFLSVSLMNRRASSPLEAPWPDLILVAEGAVGNIALEVRRRSGGMTKVVCVGRPRGRLREFDLIITSPQFGLAPAPNVLELSLPLHRLDRPAMEKAADLLRPQISHLPRPWIVLLVGGTSAPDILDEAAATGLAKRALVLAKQQVGSLLVVTSPRTSAPVERALADALGSDAHLSLWSQKIGDAYLGYLHLGDRFVVTSDSISMTTEALLTGKPVEIYRLQQRLSGMQQVIAWLARQDKPILRDFGFNSGLLEKRPERQQLADRLSTFEHTNELYELDLRAAKTRLAELLQSS
jgi:uncharacterized protein